MTGSCLNSGSVESAKLQVIISKSIEFRYINGMDGFPMTCRWMTIYIYPYISRFRSFWVYHGHPHIVRWIVYCISYIYIATYRISASIIIYLYIILSTSSISTDIHISFGISHYKNYGLLRFYSRLWNTTLTDAGTHLSCGACPQGHTNATWIGHRDRTIPTVSNMTVW